MTIKRWTWIDDLAERILQCEAVSLAKDGKFWTRQLTKPDRIELALILKQRKQPDIHKIKKKND